MRILATAAGALSELSPLKVNLRQGVYWASRLVEVTLKDAENLQQAFRLGINSLLMSRLQKDWGAPLQGVIQFSRTVEVIHGCRIFKNANYLLSRGYADDLRVKRLWGLAAHIYNMFFDTLFLICKLPYLRAGYLAQGIGGGMRWAGIVGNGLSCVAAFDDLRANRGDRIAKGAALLSGGLEVISLFSPMMQICPQGQHVLNFIASLSSFIRMQRINYVQIREERNGT